jgi:hypothetical protein
MGHHCCSKQKVKRGLWSPEEDEKLLRYITANGHSCWSAVPKNAGTSSLNLDYPATSIHLSRSRRSDESTILLLTVVSVQGCSGAARAAGSAGSTTSALTSSAAPSRSRRNAPSSTSTASSATGYYMCLPELFSLVLA